MTSILSSLTNAIENKAKLKIIYNGGSKPGTIREMSPIAIIENGEKLRAKCHTSNAVKVFVVAKISIIENSGEIIGSLPLPSPPKSYIDIDDFLSIETKNLESLGWFVKKETDIKESTYGECIYLTLHRIRKNGNPLKGDDVSIIYTEYSYDLMFFGGDESEIQNRKKRTRPWAVRGKNLETATFSRFDRAIELFIKYAKKLSPKEQS